jgi:hypothetical protein
MEWRQDLRKLFGEYTAAKQRQNVLDYDDLLLGWSEMMNNGDLKGFPAEVNRGFPRADRGRILCALIRREVGHARNVSQ